MPPEIRAVYFDLDDTLCAYWAASRKGLRQAFEESHPSIPTDELISAWRDVFSTFSEEVRRDPWYQHYLEAGHVTRKEHIRRTLARFGVEDDALITETSDKYGALRDSYLLLFDEAEDVLKTVKGAYRMGLITNGPADIQRQEVETLGIGPLFDDILIEGEMQVGKPDLRVFERARTKWGFEPNEMLFCGNSYDHDVLGALEAGWHAILVDKGAGYGTEVTGREPDLVVSDLWEIVDWLGLERPSKAATASNPGSENANWRSQ